MKTIKNRYIFSVLLTVFIGACKLPQLNIKEENKLVPESFTGLTDTINVAKTKWKAYFDDTNLIALIDTALANNKELGITLQEIEIGRNEIMARKGEYLPFVGIGGGAGFEKLGRFTRNGTIDESLEVEPGKAFPKPLADYKLGIAVSWELDVWKKLRNAKKAATLRYLSTIEGKNFMVTNLISEISSAYYKLMALDNQLSIVQKNIEIQTNALQTVKFQKEAARVTQLAVNRFDAQLLNTKNLQYEIIQQIIEVESDINFLTGRFPKPIQRNSITFNSIENGPIYAGIPAQLLVNRPDIRKAELELEAAKLDVKIAKANFYPSFRLTSGVGLQAIGTQYLTNPESIFYNLAGDLVAPLINKNGIKAIYKNANAKQIQAVVNYEQSILNAHIEVFKQLSKISNYNKSFETKSKEVDVLAESVTFSNKLFIAARADYLEVLSTQRESLASKIELVEIKLKQMEAKVDVYKALGGGWY